MTGAETQAVGGAITAAEFIARKTVQFERERDRITIAMKDIGGGKPGGYCRDAWTLMPEDVNPEKVIVLERLRYAGPDRGAILSGDVRIRVSYYMVGRRGNKRGRWTFGQFALMASPAMWRRLFDQAVHDGTIQADEWPSPS